jgi:hypothetical protein
MTRGSLSEGTVPGGNSPRVASCQPCLLTRDASHVVEVDSSRWAGQPGEGDVDRNDPDQNPDVDEAAGGSAPGHLRTETSIRSTSMQHCSTVSRPPGDMSATRAAASSIASGRWSSRRQSSAASARARPTASKPGRRARARCTNSRRASSGSRGGTGYTASPETASGSRLVARICAPGPAASTPEASRRRPPPRARSCPAPAGPAGPRGRQRSPAPGRRRASTGRSRPRPCVRPSPAR